MKNKITKFAIFENNTTTFNKKKDQDLANYNTEKVQEEKKIKDVSFKIEKPFLLKKENILNLNKDSKSDLGKNKSHTKLRILANNLSFHKNIEPTTLYVKKITKIIKKRLILKNVNIVVKPKKICALLGPNGAGKTTLFSIILGILNPTEGDVAFGGDSLIGFPIHDRAKKGLSYLPQSRSIFRGMTVEENIRSVAQIILQNNSQEDELVEYLLNEFKITHLRSASALALSGGEARRVEIARCLCANPKILLLDEPFAALDPIAIIELKQMLKNLVNKGISIFITDHNVKETLDIVDYAYIINQGEIIAEGSSKEIIENKKARQFYLGHSFKL